MLRAEPLLNPIGSAPTAPIPTGRPSPRAGRRAAAAHATYYVTKHLQQGIESDHFRVKQSMPRVGGFRSFNTARRTIRDFEAMLWLRKDFGFADVWTIREQNQLLAYCFEFPQTNKA